jgi:excisionase family DNA binding protein
MTSPLLMTIPETAAELRCHRDTVYELINTRQLKAVDIATKPGSRPKTRVRRDDLIRFIESRTRTAAHRAA